MLDVQIYFLLWALFVCMRVSSRPVCAHAKLGHLFHQLKIRAKDLVLSNVVPPLLSPTHPWDSPPHTLLCFIVRCSQKRGADRISISM